MRIGFLLYGSLDRLTGGSLYDHMLVEHLRRQGHEVESVALPMRAYARGLLDNLSRDLPARLLHARFDLLLQDELAHPSYAWLNGRLRRAGGPPVVAVVHLLRTSRRWSVWERPLYRAVERRYLASVAGWIAVSPGLLRRIAALAGVERPSIVACPAGDHAAGALTPEEIRARAHTPGPLRIVFVGNLSPMKGLDLLLDALSLLGAEGFRLDVAGSLEADPRHARANQRRVHRSALAPHVTFHGETPPGEVAALLARAHVMALPSAPESHGIAYDEAMSHGLPVIANAASDGAARFTHGHDAFVVQPGDAPALAAHLRLVRDDREALTRMGIAARRTFIACPTWEDSMERVHHFLLELHERRRQT